MAITQTTRFGLNKWSAGTDPFTRAQTNADHDAIEALGALYSQGTAGARPAAAKAGRFYFATDTGVVSYDTGSAWVTVNPAAALGGGTPAASAVADTAAEGASTAAARLDHRHAREAFGTVAAGTTYALAAANGVAATVARSDHLHGTPSLTGVLPEVIPVEGAGAIGDDTLPARADHVHPTVAAVAGAIALGDTAAEGAATSFARSDHRHSAPTAAALADLVIPAGFMGPYAGGVVPTGWLLCDGAVKVRAAYPALFTAIGTDYNTGGEAGTDFRLPDCRGRALIGAGTGSGLTNRVRATSGGAETVALTTANLASHTHTTPTHSHTVNSHSHGNTGGHSVDHNHGATGSDGWHDHPTAGGDFGSRFIITGAGAGWIIDTAVTDWQNDHNHFLTEALGDIVAVNTIEHAGTHGHSTGGANVSHTHTIPAEAPATNTAAPTTNASGSGTAHANMQPWIAVNAIIKAH